jgi:hypothetical protein
MEDSTGWLTCEPGAFSSHQFTSPKSEGGGSKSELLHLHSPTQLRLVFCFFRLFFFFMLIIWTGWLWMTTAHKRSSFPVTLTYGIFILCGHPESTVLWKG